MERWILRVRGNVQGVGYRFFCRNKAEHLGLTGTVKNQKDGSVLVAVQGEISQLMKMEILCQQGPEHSEVEGLEKQISTVIPEEKRFRVLVKAV